MALSNLIDVLSSAKAGSIAAMLAATVSAIAGIRTMIRNSDAAQLARSQDAAMKVVATRAVIAWEQFNNFCYAQKEGIVLDPYVIASATLTVKRLEEAIDQALSLGIADYLLGPGKNSVTYHAVFIQSLAHLSHSDPAELSDPTEWTKQHYMFGLVRLLDRCVNYPRSLLPDDLSQQTSRQIASLKNEAYIYMTPNN